MFKCFNICDIKNFGAKCFSYVQKKSKLDKRAKEGKYLGKNPTSPAHLVYFEDSHDVVKTRSVAFSDPNPAETESAPSSEDGAVDDDAPQWQYVATQDPSSVPAGDSGDLQEGGTSVIQDEEESLPSDRECEEQPHRYPQRQRKPPKYLDEYDTTQSSIHYFYKISNIPSNYSEACISPDQHRWQQAMQEEIAALEANHTYELVKRPIGTKVVGGRWVFARKQGANQEEVFKARYVAKGFSQVKEIDYSETFSPTARLNSLRVLLQIAANENMKLFQLDVKNAYLNAKIDHDIFLEQPKGFEKFDENGNEYVLKLQRSLYGLKQSGRLWNKLLHDFLIECDFVQSGADNCIYVLDQKGSKVIILVWVDDIVIASKSESNAQYVKSLLTNKFKMKDYGFVSNFLGIEFELSNSNIKMSQRK